MKMIQRRNREPKSTTPVRGDQVARAKTTLLRTIVIMEYIGIFYWMAYVPAQGEAGKCMNFSFLYYAVTLWPLFWCGVICIPAGLSSLDLEGQARRRYQDRLWICAGLSFATFATGVLMIPWFEQTALFTTFLGIFVPYLGIFGAIRR